VCPAEFHLRRARWRLDEKTLAGGENVLATTTERVGTTTQTFVIDVQ
jgi:hypothetical protein